MHLRSKTVRETDAQCPIGRQQIDRQAAVLERERERGARERERELNREQLSAV